MQPNFSRVRLKKIWGRTGASSHSRRKKKVSATQKVSLLFNNRHTLGSYLISLSKPIRDSEGRTPLWLAVVQIFLYVCVSFEDACAAAVRQREIEVSSRDARSSFSESALFSERLTVPPGFCDRWIYRKIKQTLLFSQIFQIAADFPQILRLDASCDVIAMRI